ncbi:unnamed protein product [Angiostrongylus costaricensis]|uniref:Rab-GAP TBC domain-containing protein n=1 Tax=Angiostrongylus costaricensis TaxID=334426 RepID=A0A0R3Q029_ANGCS|nr:unnamed protein product [Angiostrongylus costaricensis]
MASSNMSFTSAVVVHPSLGTLRRQWELNDGGSTSNEELHHLRFISNQQKKQIHELIREKMALKEQTMLLQQRNMENSSDSRVAVVSQNRFLNSEIIRLNRQCCEMQEAVRRLKEELREARDAIDRSRREYVFALQSAIRIPLHDNNALDVMHVKLLGGDMVSQLQQVLRAFCLHNATLGYCQGMNFLASTALLFVGPEDTFWFLVAMTEHFHDKSYFDDNLAGAQADQEVLKELLEVKFPLISAHLNSLDIDLATITLNWFLALFFDAVPFNTLLRIWDCFLLEGPKVLFRFSLALLGKSSFKGVNSGKMHNKTVKAVAKYGQHFEFLKRCESRLICSRKFIECHIQGQHQDEILARSDTIGIMKVIKAAVRLSYDVDGLFKVCPFLFACLIYRKEVEYVLLSYTFCSPIQPIVEDFFIFF